MSNLDWLDQINELMNFYITYNSSKWDKHNSTVQ